MYEEHEEQWNGVVSRVCQHYDNAMEDLDFAPYFTVDDVDELPILREALVAARYAL
ncbi:hypothetical protein PBI_SUZY_45 [Gordonia phage Suzy]|uniref:Uncharacterized protein n=1 Tax=Gordonia phage Suzy TaxID=2201430 RepID=A0A2Z4Q865_9CAUD|nr:hypothetical protein HOT44_gp45 [Gordonia phage Suzy]AWY06150.1 hypothetical protein PBI_SUZY_45 [Gordonia phage Suzy]